MYEFTLFQSSFGLLPELNLQVPIKRINDVLAFEFEIVLNSLHTSGKPPGTASYPVDLEEYLHIDCNITV